MTLLLYFTGVFLNLIGIILFLKYLIAHDEETPTKKGKIDLFKAFLPYCLLLPCLSWVLTILAVIAVIILQLYMLVRYVWIKVVCPVVEKGLNVLFTDHYVGNCYKTCTDYHYYKVIAYNGRKYTLYHIDVRRNEIHKIFAEDVIKFLSDRHTSKVVQCKKGEFDKMYDYMISKIKTVK